ncbi:uncharacterized protein UTRI_02222_B [Ustilago trichophora]|uniref:RGS domain-containing protein n=1 Tax=Ustilago trichophora TaxID=86804 RepID=A0A5C3DUQ7_9BASI|nr:uncharacterized protein UTRI_02222_B [Ustilago trichophora]
MTLPAGTAHVSANTGGTPPAAQWRSATEHDVYADNRDEDIFGWIQPDEWDTVAGPNKDNFLRGDCVECVADQDKSTVPSTLQSCGGPSCGYGAQCCEYSRRATHTKGPSELAPALLLQRSNKATAKSRIDDLAKVEQKTSLGVSLIDIIHGRSCRPISLLDLRTFLHFQRQPHKRLPSYYPASDMQSSAIDDFDLNLDLSTSPPSPHLIKEKQVAQRLHYDEVDALDFLVAYERYLTKFRDQSRADRLKSPDPATCKAAVRAYVRRQCRTRVSSDLTAMDVLLQGGDVANEEVEIPEEVEREVLARLKPTDLGLKPETQPLRVEFDRMVHRYLCSQRVCILPSSRKNRRKRDSGSSSDTAAGGAETPALQLGSSNNDKMPRLRWMVDVGLISESDLQLSLAECDFSTHPDVLAPIAEAVYAYMSQHVVPFFFISVARNLSPNTKRGRLLVGVVCTIIALVFSILLIVTPSPLAPRANHGTGEIVRWWRLLTAPIWCAGLGYILAYFSGLCVWLTLRGNREPDEEEEREREEIRSRISGEDVVGFDLAELQAAVDERDLDAEQDTNRWMAPEIADILTGITGQKKDKHKRQRSSSDIRGLRHLEEGRQRSKSEVTEAALSAKVSFEQSFAPSNVILGLASPLSIERDSALTMPAAVIMHTLRRPSAMIGATEAVGRPSAAFSVLDLAANSVRPSLDRAGNSLNDLRQADAVVGSGNSPSAPALMRQKRVPLFNFSIGIVTASGNDLAEERVDAPVLTRDALLFDPELAARIGSPTFATAPLEGAAGPVAGASTHSSPPPVTRRKSLAHALLPLKSSNRMQAQLQGMELSSPTRERSDDADMEKEDLALPTLPEPTVLPKSPLNPRDIAPWSAPSAVSVDLASSARPLLFSLPASRKSRLSATTSTTAVGPIAAAPSAPKRAYDESQSTSFKERLWTAIQRGTGFAVGTERVLDERVRRAQQMKALRIMALNTLATVVVVVIVVAIP